MADLRRSLLITFFSSTGTLLIHFVISVILARMLSSSEIGVYSMTVVFVGIAHMFRDFGVATYVQREPVLTTDKMRSAIGVMFASAWIISAFLFAISEPVSRWFNEPAMVPVMRVLALGFIVIPFGSITHSLLTRELAAGKQAIVTAASTASYAVSCLGLAALNFGTLSIAYANLISLIVTAIAYIPFRPKGMPWLPSFVHWREIVHFGGGTVLSNCLAEVNASIPDVVLGKLSGAAHVGLFSRANSTVSLFRYVANGVINYGAVSYMSQAYHRGESLSPLLTRAVSLVVGIGWPAFAFTALLGADIVATLYGTKWLECVPAILPLALAAGLSMLFQYTPTAFSAIGLPYMGSVSTAVMLVSRIIFASVMFNGTIVSFAWAILFATIVTVPVLIWQQWRYIGFGPLLLFKVVLPNAIVTVICIVACEFMLFVLPASLPPIFRLCILVLPLAIIWYIALRVVKHELVAEVHHLITGLTSRVARVA